MYFVKRSLRDAIGRAIKRRVETFIPGGALGVDQWAAEIVLDTRRREINESYHRESSIKLIIAQPFPSQSAKWPQDSRRQYDKILQKADRIIAVNDDPYVAQKIQIRNEWMVDNSDAVIAVWNGTPGWVSDTADYAREKGKPILLIDPVEQSEKWIMD